MQKERLSKVMAQRGLCSRREADRLIEAGWVFVDGQRISKLGTRIDPGCGIRLADEALARHDAKVTILLNKPVGVVSGQPEKGYRAAVSLISNHSHWRQDRSPIHFSRDHLFGLAPAGRLDIDSTGLLVLTQCGHTARSLIGPESEVEKEYLVRISGTLSTSGLRLLNHGLSLDGKPLRPAQVEWQNRDQLRFVLTEGRKRQIRRMCESVGVQVAALKRVRIGQVRLGGLPQGEWRYLAPDEKF